MTTKGPYNTITATGTASASATEINADLCAITAGTSGAGVRLDAMNPKDKRKVANYSSTSEYYVYPASGGKINNRTADYGVLLPPNAVMEFECVDSVNVWASGC
jgi:hypothetical protein